MIFAETVNNFIELWNANKDMHKQEWRQWFYQTSINDEVY